MRGSAEKSTIVCARTESGMLSSTFAPISYTFNLASLQAAQLPYLTDRLRMRVRTRGRLTH